jgi:hypothetical protein
MDGTTVGYDEGFSDGLLEGSGVGESVDSVHQDGLFNV